MSIQIVPRKLSGRLGSLNLIHLDIENVYKNQVSAGALQPPLPFPRLRDLNKLGSSPSRKAMLLKEF